MGLLRHSSTGRTVILSNHNVAGRAGGCAVWLVDPAASNDHASLSWSGARWEARDLGSTNGTCVEGAGPLRPGESVPLALGTVLRFGCDAERWELTDDREPMVLARSVDAGEVRAAEDGLLVLPSPEDVEVSIVSSAGAWHVEASDGTRRLAVDREHLILAGRPWELYVPPAAPIVGTYKEKDAPTLANIALRFRVSPDEEHVRIEALYPGGVLSLGERSSFYLLLLLARERIHDAGAGERPDAEQGWYHVVDLTKALDIQEPSLNVLVFRARETFAKAGVESAEGIIERRPRQLRIGVRTVEEANG